MVSSSRARLEDRYIPVAVLGSNLGGIMAASTYTLSTVAIHAPVVECLNRGVIHAGLSYKMYNVFCTSSSCFFRMYMPVMFGWE